MQLSKRLIISAPPEQEQNFDETIKTKKPQFIGKLHVLRHHEQIPRRLIPLLTRKIVFLQRKIEKINDRDFALDRIQQALPEHSQFVILSYNLVKIPNPKSC